MSATKVVCPQCGEREGLRILWGMPHPDEMGRDDVVFGGCVVPTEPVNRSCQSCGARWQAP